MRKLGQFLLLMLLVVGLYSLSSCGGAAGTLGSSVDLPGGSTGVTSGDFKAIRYNDRGYEDSSLNPTLGLQVSQDGAMTTVTVAIADTAPMLGAAVELHYDPAHYSPVKSEFAGLVDTPLELAASHRAGIVSLGQVDTEGAELRSGQFATVTFSNSPVRNVSADGDAHQFPVNRGYTPTQPGAPNIPSGLAITKAAVDATPAEYKIYSFFAVGDGDANGSTTLGDLTAMVFNGYFGSANVIDGSDWGAMTTDYDGNGETNISDLSTLAPRLGEATTSIDVLIKDNNGTDFAGTETVLANHTWASATAPARPPADNTVNVDTLMRTWTGTVDQAAVTAADTNGDGIVVLSAIAKGAGANSPVFTDNTLTVTAPVGPAGVVVSGFTGNIDAATDQPFDSATGLVSLTAGEAITLEITGVNGTYDPQDGSPTENFIGGPSANMPQDAYDDALAAVQTAAAWTVTTAGDSTNNEFRTSVPVLNLAATTGSGITGSVTPDADNPDSTDLTTPEGTLSLNIPTSGTFIPLALTANISIDVVDDAAAPVFGAISSDQPDVNNYIGLNPAGSTTVSAELYPGAAILPLPTAVTLSLVPTYGSGETVGTDATITLTYTANPAPAAGEFAVAPIVGPPAGVRITAVIPSAATPGVIYGLQASFDNAGTITTTSVNYPADSFLTTAPPPPPVTFDSIPSGELISKNDVLFITYPEPQLRRDPRVAVGSGNVTPIDPQGYGDFVKATGNSFALTSQQRQTGAQFDDFPQVVLIEGTDAAGITSTTASEPVNVWFRGPNGIVLDISNQTFTGAAVVEYAYKVFGAAADQANWPNLGTGTFSYNPTGIAPGGPVAIDYGVNAFTNVTRGDLDLAGRDFADKVFDASTINTSTPDVLFFEVSNFGFFDFDVADPFDVSPPFGAGNTRLRFTDVNDNSQTMVTALMPAAVNLGVAGNVLVMLEVTADHFANIGVPAWPGILDPGQTYELAVFDPQVPGSDSLFVGDMTVIGVNPN